MEVVLGCKGLHVGHAPLAVPMHIIPVNIKFSGQGHIFVTLT